MLAMKKSLWKSIVICMLALTCVLFTGTKSEASAVTTPAQVTNLRFVDYDTFRVALSWTAQSQSGVKYEIWKSKGTADNFVLAGTSSYNEGWMSGLDAGSTYYIKVRAYVTGSTGNVYGAYSSNLKVVTSPNSRPTNVKQSAAKETSATIKWSKVTGADGYRVVYKNYESGKQTSKTTKTNSITLTKLSKNARYLVAVYAYRQDGTALKAEYDYGAYPDDYIRVLPTAPSGIKIVEAYESVASYYFKINNRASAKGLQYQVRNSKNASIASGYDTFTSSEFNARGSKIKRNQFYKVRVRGYVTIGTKKVYGKWSSDVWFAGNPQPKTYSKSDSGIKISWAKTSGANSYTVYVSTKRDSGYKKVGTTTKNNILVKKYGSKSLVKGKTYYFSWVANKKVGSKTYKSVDDKYVSVVY